jgi:phenylpyruvate tautomerase PptA (4-oxalocrotonate tautomerase family)
MPHLTVHAIDDDLTGRELELIAALTDAVVAVYGDWARDLVDVRLIGLPRHRWGVGGRPVAAAAVSIAFSLREAAFARPDADEVVTALIASLTDAVAVIFGEQVRPAVTVELIGVPAGRTGVGGLLVS